jgi:hypothetical protein
VIPSLFSQKTERSRLPDTQKFTVFLKHLAFPPGSTNTKLYLVDELEFGLIGAQLYSTDFPAVFQSIEAGTASGGVHESEEKSHRHRY